MFPIFFKWQGYNLWGESLTRARK